MKIDAKKLHALAKSIGLTNAGLAARAGISRQALQGMLRGDDVVEVRANTAKGLARALRLPDESLLSPDPLARYKETVAAEHAELSFRGLGLPVTEPRPMDELFVPVRVVRLTEGPDDRRCQPATAADDEPQKSDELTVGQCLSLYRRVLIRGEPGSGKTTALRHTARSHARGDSARADLGGRRRVPLLIRLAEFAKARERDPDMGLVRFAVTRALRDAPPAYWTEVELHVARELERGNCLVMFDGLDEIGGEPAVSATLREFIAGHDRNQFVLTSRVVGLDAGPWQEAGFLPFQIVRWREEDIRQFAERWYATRTTSGKGRRRERDQRAGQLAAEILSQPSLREIAANPLMLTILAALHYADAALPRRRLDLYAKIVEVMLESWEASKRDARPGDPLHGIVLEAREFAWLLARLALGMQREGGVLRPRWWVSDAVQRFLGEQLALDGDQIKEQSERVIRYLCERTGLLVERGDGVFGFYHRTFQEFFAARGLLLEAESGKDIMTLLRPYLYHPQWEEVVILVAASLVAPRATDLVRVILDDPEPAGRFLRRGQHLALRCLADGASIADRAMIDQIFADGAAIGRSRWVWVAIRFIDLLNRLRGSKHAPRAEQMRREIEEAAKRELPESDYLTLYLSSHEPPSGPHDAPPGTICPKRVGGRTVKLAWYARAKRIEDPEAWFDEVLAAIRDTKTSLDRRLALICMLGDETELNDAARHTLRRLLVKDPHEIVRAICADVLEQAAEADDAVVKALLDRVEKDGSDMVREASAKALRGVVPKRADVRLRLEELFRSGSAAVRAGAIRGLSRLDFAAPGQKELLDKLLDAIKSRDEASQVRCACIWTIASQLEWGKDSGIDGLIESCLDDGDRAVSWAALHVLADAIVEGRKEWSWPLVERVEQTLMGVSNPCPHLFGDLVMIVAMKEVLGARRLEHLLADALAPFGDQVVIAFVFGSVARTEQGPDSDIDLMLIGDVRLKDLVVRLKGAEQALGRTINPALYTPADFRAKYQAGDPFLLEVMRREKLFLIGDWDELRLLAADRHARPTSGHGQ